MMVRFGLMDLQKYLGIQIQILKHELNSIPSKPFWDGKALSIGPGFLLNPSAFLGILCVKRVFYYIVCEQIEMYVAGNFSLHPPFVCYGFELPVPVQANVRAAKYKIWAKR